MLQESNQMRVTKRPWTSNVATHDQTILVADGQNLEEIVIDCIQTLQREGIYNRAQARRLLRYARVWVDGIPIHDRKSWASIYPQKGAHIHIYEGAKGGGGGGKSIIPLIGMIVLAVVAPFVGGLVAGGLGLVTATGALTTLGSLVSGVVGIGIMLGGSMLLNALFPQAQPSLGNFNTDAGQASQAYQVSGSQNNVNPEGYIPVVFGKHRFTPPRGSKSWTMWEGDQQYFHMLVVWGQADLSITDMRIDKTPLSDFTAVEEYTHVTNGDNLKFFGQSPNENSVGASLKYSDGWVSRTVGEAEALSVDIQFQALFSVDSGSGALGWASVDLEIQYREKGTEDWKDDFFAGNRVEINSFDENLRSVSYWYIYADKNGNVFAEGAPTKTSSSTGDRVPVYPNKGYQIYPNKNQYITGCGVTITSLRDAQGKLTGYSRVEVNAGVYNKGGLFTVSNNTRDLVVRPFRREGLPKATYEIRIRRLTEDTDSQYLYDAATWATMRAFINKPAFNSINPQYVTELRIRATEQLSGYVSQLNALVCSKARDFDVATGQWVYRETQNPASLGLYALTSKYCLIEPFLDKRIDFPSFEEFHAYNVEKGYSFNFIADTEVALWERLVQIYSVGRGAPTSDIDGKWGVIIDRGGKEVKQLFTPRNSWGMKFSRTFADMPHALRVSFVDADSEYTQQEQYVCWDGYTMDLSKEPTKKLATNIEPWDYAGVVTWAHLYPLARRHLAKLRHRQNAISLSTDWEWLAVRRGDLVAVASDTLMNTFGDAVIMALIYEVDGQEIIVGDAKNIPTDESGVVLIPIGLQLNDTIIFSEPWPARYGIAMRDSLGRVSGRAEYEIIAFYGEEEHQDLYFKHELHPANVPAVGDLCVVSLLGEEYEEYLFATATPNERAACELTLIPYVATELDAAESGPIPPFVPPVILDAVGGAVLSTPIVLLVKSDESVLSGVRGSTSPTIKVWVQSKSGTVDTSQVSYQISVLKDGDIASRIANGEQGVTSVSISDVTEKALYAVKVRAVDVRLGITSAWSAPIQHIVIGRTTPPPAPTAVYLDGNVLNIEQQNRPIDLVGHVITVCMDATDTIGMGKVVTSPYITEGKFDLAPYVGRARKIYVQAIDEIGLLSSAVFVLIQLGDIVPENVLFEFSEQDRDWSGELVGGKIIDLDAYADVTSVFYAQDDSASFYPQDDSAVFYPSTTGTAMTYTYQLDLVKSYLGADLKVMPKVIGGHVSLVEYKLIKDEVRYPQNESDLLYSQLDTDVFYPQGLELDWQLLPSSFTVAGEGRIIVRVVMSPDSQGVLDDIVTVVDVEDKTLHLSDVIIDGNGLTRVEIPQGYFRGITNVQITLQYIEGSVAVSGEYIKGSEIKVGDYVSHGQLLRALDANKQLTSASADLFVLGY